MKILFLRSRRDVIRLFIALTMLTSLFALFQPAPTFAQGSNCKTSGPASAVYTLTACITAPANGASVSGSRTVSATVTVTGTNPGIAKLIFYLGGEYLITDYQSTYTFILPTKKWVDGTRLLEVEAIMRDGFTSQRASITLNFNNGIVTPPVNNKTFTPSGGTTPPTGQAFTVAATGDGADGATHAGNVTDLINSWNPNLFLYLGDVYDDGTFTEFHNWYGTSSKFFGRFRSITNPVIGNHEYENGQAPGYFDYWDNVQNYYSYDAAGWHFIALNSNCGLLPICSVGQPQYQWLQNDLSTHTNICTIAYFHHPVYNIGPEGYGTRMSDIWTLLAQNGVDIVLNGHDHNYQRWKPLDGNGAVSATGVTQFVAGGGGHGTQQFITSDSRMVTGFDTTPNAFGALRLQLNQYGAGYQYINTAGIMLDSGSVRCSGAPADTVAPSKPTNLSASSSSPQLVQLTWTASTDNVGVTGYSIYRDGALLTTIGPATSYNDTTVQLGTSYSYQIRAHDAAGNTSTLSSSATVTTPVLLFSDGFESGNLSKWTSVNGLTVQQQEVQAGTYAVRAKSTGTATHAYKDLSPTQNELYYRVWFKILSQGSNSVYLQRFRTSNNGALLGVLVTSTGKLSTRNDVAGVTTTSTTVVPPGVWHELQVRVLINGTASQTEVWLDGTRIDSLSQTQNLGTTPIGRIQLGDSSTGRTYDVALDQVALSTQFIGSSNPPVSTVTPTRTPTRTRTPTAGPSPTRTPTATRTATSGAGSTLNFVPVADARVSEASPTTRYGTATTLLADDSAGARQITYIRFAVSGVSSSIQSVKLRVYCTTNGTANGPAAYLAGNNWDEAGTNGVTWNTRPALSSAATDNKAAIGTSSWAEYNVSSLVAGNGTYTFALVADSSDGVTFSSREGTTSPQLVITLGAGALLSADALVWTDTPTLIPVPTETFTLVPMLSDTPTLTPTLSAVPNDPSPTETNTP
jgi:hypothetical protein